jgi:hypothetical protein
MAKAPHQENDFRPDAWARFERFIRDVAKAGPQHRTTSKAKAKPKKTAANRKAKKPGR